VPFGPVPAQIIAYRYVTSGRVFVGLDREKPVQIGAGNEL